MLGPLTPELIALVGAELFKQLLPVVLDQMIQLRLTDPATLPWAALKGASIEVIRARVEAQQRQGDPPCS